MEGTLVHHANDNNNGPSSRTIWVKWYQKKILIDPHPVFVVITQYL